MAISSRIRRGTVTGAARLINFKTKAARLAAVLGCVITLSLIAFTPAQAATTTGHPQASRSVVGLLAQNATNSDPFFVVNANSGLCLGISGGADDAPAVQWTCETVANQEWHWGSELGSTGYYQLVNGDGQCLGVAGTSEGARIYGWTCTGAANQYWDPVDGKYGTVLWDYNSGMVVGVAGTAVGAPVVQWDFTGALNQYWGS